MKVGPANEAPHYDPSASKFEALLGPRGARTGTRPALATQVAFRSAKSPTGTDLVKPRPRGAQQRSMPSATVQPGARTQQRPIDAAVLETYFKTKFPDKIDSVTGVEENGLIHGTFKNGSIFQGSSLLGRVNPKTGQILYTFERFEDAIRRATLGAIKAVNDDGILHGEKGFARINLANGDVKWTTLPTFEGFSDLSSFTNWATHRENTEIKIDPKTGQWTQKIEFTKENKYTELGGVAAREVLYPNDNIITSQVINRDPITGNTIWKLDLPHELGNINFIDGRGDTVFADNGFIRFDKANGNILHTIFHPRELGAFKSYLGDNLIRYDKGLVIFNQKTGDIIHVPTQAGLGGFRDYFGDNLMQYDKGLIALNTETGSIVSIPTQSDLGDFKRYLGDGIMECDHGLIKIDTSTGNKIWSLSTLELNSKGFGPIDSYDKKAALILFKNGAARIEDGKIQWSKKADRDPAIGDAVILMRGDSATRLQIGRAGVYIDNGSGRISTTDDIPPDVTAQLEKFNIRHDVLNRLYGPEFPGHVAKMRGLLERAQPKPNATPSELDDQKMATEQLASKPVVVIFDPQGDWNGAYRQANYDEFMRRYNVLYFEMANDRQFEEGLKSLSNAKLHPEISIIGGHGTQTRIDLATPEDPSKPDPFKMIDLSDREMLSRYSDIFTGTIILNSCSTGQQGEQNAENMVSLIASTLGANAKRISGPKIPAWATLLFSPDGSFTGVRYPSQDAVFTISH